MKILFIAGFAPIVADPAAAWAFYVGKLALPLDESAGDYVFTHKLGGAKHFGLWPLAEAAESCFHRKRWPKEIPVPQAALELEVDDVAAAAAELEAGGQRLIHGARQEPWGQTIARLLTADGLLLGLCHTPALHR